jgi:hypothetical protein
VKLFRASLLVGEDAEVVDVFVETGSILAAVSIAKKYVEQEDIVKGEDIEVVEVVRLADGVVRVEDIGSGH